MRLEKSRLSDPSSLLAPSEVKLYRTMIAQVQWVARESRPDVSGCASLQSAALPSPTVADAQLVITACKYLKSTASQRLTIWQLDP
eukprot:6406966-Pyramimonas_sp.AAC.1